MIRIPLSILPAAMIVLALFWVLHSMIQVATKPPVMHERVHLVDFVRLKTEQRPVRKERVKPKRPTPKKQPLKPKVAVQKKVAVDSQPVLPTRIDLDLPLDLSAVSALGDAVVAQPAAVQQEVVSTNVLPISRVRPIYPRRARRMKQEGFVKLEFTISAIGTVKDVKVVESHPRGIFDDSAKQALLKWKFKPKVVSNQAVEQRALIQIDYRLNT